MAIKKIIDNQPKYGDSSQYNFSDDETNFAYQNSISLPKNNDKFQSKDLYTKAVGSDLNAAIIERNLKSEEGTSYIRIEKLYISENASKKSGNNRCEAWLFSQEDYPDTSFDSAGYSTIRDALKNSTRFYRDDINQKDGGKDWGQAAGLDGQNIIQDLNSDSIEIEDFANNHTDYNPKGSFPLRDTSIHTTIIDENIYNPIYFVIRLRGDETEGHGTDVRKRIYQVYKINNLDLFDYDNNGNPIPKITYFDDTNLISRVNVVEGDGGGAGDEKPKWKVFQGDFHVSINTLGSQKNDWEGEPDDTDGDDEKLYEQYFASVEPPMFFDKNFKNPINILNISPDRQLGGNAISEPPGPSQQTYGFPDFFPTTTISVLSPDGNLQPYDLQSYYDGDEQLLIRQQTSAPTTIGLTYDLVNPNTSFTIVSNFFYFVIDWDDKDDKIKTLEDWMNVRPTTLSELLELQQENLYELMINGSEVVNKTWTLYGEGYEGDAIPNPYELFPDELGFEQGDDFGGLRHSSYQDNIEWGTYETANKACQLLGHTGYEWYSQDEGGPGGTTTSDPTPNLVYWDGEQWLKEPNEYQTGYYERLDCVDLTYAGFEEKIPTHTYNTPGIKTIKSIVFSYQYNQNNGQYMQGRWKLVTSRFYLDIPINQYPDFGEVGGADYTTIPWPYTTAVIGGTDEASKYKQSIQNTLSSGKIGDVDIIDEKFLVNDLENDELGKSINKMDLEQTRYFNKSYDINTLLNIDVGGQVIYDNQYLQNDYLDTLLNPIYFQEFDLDGDGVLTDDDITAWDSEYARPDIALYMTTIGVEPTLEEIEQAFDEAGDPGSAEILGQFQLYTNNQGDSYVVGRYWSGELGQCTGESSGWTGLTGGNDTITEMGFESPFTSNPPSEVCSWFFAEQCPEFDSCYASRREGCDTGNCGLGSCWAGFDCFSERPGFDEFAEQYIEENTIPVPDSFPPTGETFPVITEDNNYFDDPSWDAGTFQFILWGTGDGATKSNIVPGWDLIAGGPIPSNNQMVLNHNEDSIELHNTTSDNLYIKSKGNQRVFKGIPYQVGIQISGEGLALSGEYIPGIFETAGGLNGVQLQDGINEFEWTPTWDDDDESKPVVIRRGPWSGSTQNFKVKVIFIISPMYPEPNFEQYNNDVYFDSAEQIFNPYTDSYWDGDVNKFPMESSVGQIFISDNQDLELKTNCKLELNTGELTGKSIYDSSGNSNKGLLIGDYKIKKNRKGEPMRRDSFIKVPKKTNNRNGAL